MIFRNGFPSSGVYVQFTRRKMGFCMKQVQTLCQKMRRKGSAVQIFRGVRFGCLSVQRVDRG